MINLREVDGRVRFEIPLPAAEKSNILLSALFLSADGKANFSNSVADLLRGMQHEVRVAHDSITALQESIEFQPDFAVLDIGLPRLNGYDLEHRLRDSPAALRLKLHVRWSKSASKSTTTTKIVETMTPTPISIAVMSIAAIASSSA